MLAEFFSRFVADGGRLSSSAFFTLLLTFSFEPLHSLSIGYLA
jgi:hypothetical protein